MARKSANPFFDVLRGLHHHYSPDDVVALLTRVDESRVERLANSLSSYLQTNLPAAIERRDGLAAYRTNPYVLLTSASVMSLDDPVRFADFLFNSKLYMGLETSFGKSIEGAFVEGYPLNANATAHWEEPIEKRTEFDQLNGLSREQRARQRTTSVWREIDRSCVVGNRRFLTSIKSGPNTINDTQVQGMTAAIVQNHSAWAAQTRSTYPDVTQLDVVIGLTYGTDRTTNNKDNQILVKLLDQGFEEEERESKPGILIDSETRSTRIYRRVGRDFWAFIGNPINPENTSFVFLEILLGLLKSLSIGMGAIELEAKINKKIQALALALSKMQFPRNSLPSWVREDFTDNELFWFATALSAFYDEGI